MVQGVPKTLFVEGPRPTARDTMKACYYYLNATIIPDAPEHWNSWFTSILIGGEASWAVHDAVMAWLGPVLLNRIEQGWSGPPVDAGLDFMLERDAEYLGEDINGWNGWAALIRAVELDWSDDDAAWACRAGLSWREMESEGLTVAQRKALPTLIALGGRR